MNDAGTGSAVRSRQRGDYTPGRHGLTRMWALAQQGGGGATVSHGTARLQRRAGQPRTGERELNFELALAGYKGGHGLTWTKVKVMGKPAFVSATKATRTDGTKRAYLRGGFILLARARKTTNPGDLIDAFRVLFGDTDLVYRPATTRLYQQQVKAVIARKLSDGELSLERARSGFAEIKALLVARRGPCEKRTSRAKLKGGTYAEYRRILADFVRRSRLPRGLDRTDTVLALMVKVGPWVGLRPCEWLRAAIVGDTLRIVNAKGGNGRALGEEREIVLSGLPLKIVTLVSHLTRQVPLLFAEAGNNWRRVLGRLGERLARLCARIEIRRWSLYTTRHVAIANWKRAGLSDAEIAALTGHSSTRTARRHYASGRYGWTAEFACARPKRGLVAEIVARNAVTTCPVSVKSEALSVAPTDAVSSAYVSEPSALPAGIPHRVIVVERQYQRVSFVSIIRDNGVAARTRIDTIWEPGNASPFCMG